MRMNLYLLTIYSVHYHFIFLCFDLVVMPCVNVIKAGEATHFLLERSEKYEGPCVTTKLELYNYNFYYNSSKQHCT